MSVKMDFWRPASFRGAPFFVEDFDRSGGRRGPDHEFPFKEEGFPEDTGKSMESYSITAYVVRRVGESEYASRRDALIAALNQPGPGELSHPAFGSVQVQVRSWSVQESKGVLGLAKFQLAFKEAAEPTYPTAQRSAAAGMPGMASAARAAIMRAFSGAFSIGGKSDYLRDCARERVESAGSLFAKLAGSCGVGVNIGVLVDAIVDLVDNENDGAALAERLWALPQTFTAWHEEPWRRQQNADGTYRGVSNLKGYGPLAPTAVSALYRAFDYDGVQTENAATSILRRQEAANTAAIAAIVRQGAVVEAARVAPFVNWRTLEEAETARDRIVDALESEAAATGDDAIYEALYALRLAVANTVPPDGGKLPSLVEYAPLVTMPSLALSYRLYGSMGRADELAEINGLRHPGFVAGAVPIQVLSHVG